MGNKRTKKKINNKKNKQTVVLKQIEELSKYVDYCNDLQELYLKKHQEVMDLYEALKILKNKLSKKNNKEIKNIFNSIENMKNKYNSKKLRNNLNRKIKDQNTMRKKNKDNYKKISNKISKIKLELN